MNKILFSICATLALLCPVATGGDFTLQTEDSSGVWFEYTGYVTDNDADDLHDIMWRNLGREVFITINSGGGSAYGGLALFWEAERWDNLTTIAGKDYGAWSAAAMFWLGSPRDYFEGEDAVVAFHQAYCDPFYPPGCNLEPFRAQSVPTFDRAGYFGEILDAALTEIQMTWGVEGWLKLTDEGWFFYHSGHGIQIKVTPVWEI